MVSLGTSVDCSLAAIGTARVKIAVVNPHVPFAYGDLVPIDTFDYLVKDDNPRWFPRILPSEHRLRC